MTDKATEVVARAIGAACDEDSVYERPRPELVMNALSAAGYAVVPVEPTPAMLEAFCRESAKGHQPDDFTPVFTRAYRAMLATTKD